MKKTKVSSLFLIIFLLVSCSLLDNYKQVDEWNLILLNKDHKVPKSYEFKLLELSNGERVDTRIYPDLQEMFDDMRAQGLDPEVKSGYRPYKLQEELFNEGIEERIEQGMSKRKAKEDTAKSIAIPGTSEHQVGLAVDIGVKNPESDLYAVYDWLALNAHKYGFILRYPYGKTEITGILYEPWHYRYVGRDHAQIIYNNQITLEEYLKEYY